MKMRWGARRFISNSEMVFVRTFFQMLLLLVFCCFPILPIAQAAPPPVIPVKACGVSANGNAQAASVDAQKKAVEKILSKMMMPNSDASSIYQKILGNFKDYAGKPDVKAQKNVGSELQLYSTVPVKVAHMNADVRDAVGVLQRNHKVNKTGFLIRVCGLPDAKQRDNAQGNVTGAVGDTFENIGFSRIAIDDAKSILDAHTSDDCPTFVSSVRGVLHQDYPEITTAVIGEVDISEIAKDADGVTVNGTIYLCGIDMLKGEGTTYADFRETYSMREMNEKDAMEFFLYKAGLNAARQLEDRTLSYWQHGTTR